MSKFGGFGGTATVQSFHKFLSVFMNDFLINSSITHNL